MGELASLAEAAGGDINAYTMSDATCYILTCLPEMMEACLRAMADALWQPNFDPLELERERGVILEEIHRADDDPEQELQKKLFRLAYGKRHPYGRPVLGSIASVRRMDVPDLRRYHRRGYEPAQACIVLAGLLDEKEIRRCAGGILAGLGKKARSAPSGRKGKIRADHKGKIRAGRKGKMRVPGPAPASRGPRFFALHGRTGTAHFEMAFEVPPVTHPDAPAIEVLSMILGAGESSRLYRALCVEAGILHDVSTDPFLSAGPGLLFLGGGGDTDKIGLAAAEVIRQALALGGSLPPREEEVARVQRWFEADLEFRRESAGGRARIAGYAEIVAGNPRFALQYLDRILKLTPKKVAQAARRYIRLEGLTAGAMLPVEEKAHFDGKTFRKAVLSGFRESGSLKVPPPLLLSSAGEGKAGREKRSAHWKKPRKRAAPVEMALPGGARLVVLPGDSPPVFSLRAVFLGGQRLEGAANAGLHYLMSHVASQATKSLSAKDMAQHLDGLAATLNGFAGRNSFGISASALSSVAGEVVEVFAESLRFPSFDAEDIALAKREADADRRSDLDDLAHLSHLRVMSHLYGKHPFGRHPLGSRKTMGMMDAETLKNAWRRWAVPENMVIGASGAIDPDWLADQLRRHLHGWEKTAPKWRTPRPPALPVDSRGPGRHWQRMERALQSHIRIAYLGAAFDDPRRFVLSVLSAALGSQGGGLFMELRERRGLAYAVSVSAEESLDPGPFMLYAATSPKNEDEVIRLMREEVMRVREEGLAAYELDRAKAFLIGEYTRVQQHARARASELAFSKRYGLSYESAKDWKRHIEKVRGEDVRAAARGFLAPERECLYVLGPPRGRENSR